MHDRVSTTKEVWTAIWTAHQDALQVYSSYSNPLGSSPEMSTEYSLPGVDHPLIGIRWIWDNDLEGEHFPRRVNEEHHYWLCVIKED